MQTIELKAHAKVNLSLEVVGKREDGYHDIISFMQDVSLYDDVVVSAGTAEAVEAWLAATGSASGEVVEAETNSLSGAADAAELSDMPDVDSPGKVKRTDKCKINGIEVYFGSDSDQIPTGMANLAMRGAGAVLQAAPGGIEMPPAIGIRITKKLPIAAGIAGGSGNAAAVMLGINKLAGNILSLKQLMDLGARIGADIPFSLMMNAYRNSEALAGLDGLEWARPSAMTRGIGDIVEPCEPITRYVIMINPGVAVSTGEAYTAIDSMPKREINTELFYNIFEEYACNKFPEIRELITDMSNDLAADRVLMSGSGSTVVAYYVDEATARTDITRITDNDWAGRGWRIWYAVSGGCR